MTVQYMYAQICFGILVAFMLGLPYASEELYSVRIFDSEVGWWRVMLAMAVLPALCQVCSCAAPCLTHAQH